MGSITYFLAVGTKALKGLQPGPLVTGHYSGCCGRTAMGPAVSRTTGTAPLPLSLPSAQVPAANRDSLGTACSVAESRF